MTPTEPTRAMLRLVDSAKHRARLAGPYNGQPTPANAVRIKYCTQAFQHGSELYARLIYTRDAGMVDSGWWKNRDYSQCVHLSLSFLDLQSREPAPQDRARARLWCMAFFGEHMRKLWVEPPFSDVGKARDVYHYRLFLEPDWQTPLVPRKEVYSREFIAMGWRTFSEVHGVDRIGEEAPP